MAQQTRSPASDQPNGDAETASALAQQVAASADGVTWRKVTTLLDLFGVYRLTTDVRRRIATALEEADLIAKPPITDVQRFETVRLALDLDRDGRPDEPDEAARSRTMSRLLPIDDVIEATEWKPGQSPESKTVFSCTEPTDGVRWFHVD